MTDRSDLPAVGVVVPAAGSGSRMGGRRKQYLLLLGEPLLLWALGPFLRRSDVTRIVVALPSEDAEAPPEWLVHADRRITVVPGGRTRGHSVAAGLDALGASVDLVAVHDGARPLLEDEALDRCITEAREGTGAVTGWPAVDTLKVVDSEMRIVETPDRDTVWHAQTPQVFPRDVLARAYASASPEALEATDDSSLVEALGVEVRMVRGSSTNLKVTIAQDLAVAESLLRSRNEGRRSDGTPE